MTGLASLMWIFPLICHPSVINTCLYLILTKTAVISAHIRSLFSSAGAEESAAGGPERSREPAGSPENPGWKPSLPAGRAPNAHWQSQSCSEWNLRTEESCSPGQRRHSPTLALCVCFSLKRSPHWKQKDRVPLRVPATKTGTTGTRAWESWKWSVNREEAAGDQTTASDTSWSAATWETRESWVWGSGEESGGDSEDSGRTNQDHQSL